MPFSALTDADGADVSESIPDESSEVMPQVLRAEHERVFAGLLADLAPVPASIVRMKTYDDMSFRQISSALQMPLNTVKSHYRRTLMALRRLLEP